MGLSKAAVVRLAKKVGANRVSADLYGEAEEMFVEVLDNLLTRVLLHTKNRKKKTVTIDDVRNALKSMNMDILIDTKVRKFDFPIATFKTDLKSMSTYVLQLANPSDQWKPRFTKDAVNGMMTFITDYMKRYIRSAVGLDSHSDGKTVKARDLINVCEICKEKEEKEEKEKTYPHRHRDCVRTAGVYSVNSL